MRELVTMAEARSREEWHRTAHLAALIANCHRDPKRHRPFHPRDFHPFPEATDRRRATAPRTGDLSILKTVFVDRRPPPKGA